MRYPAFLKEKGTIGFVAPAFGCATEPYISAFANAEERFRKLGYGLLEGPNCHEKKGIGISNTPEACAAEFMDFYTRKGPDILLSCGGGEQMCEILPFLDFDALRAADPRWFMGMSDNTNLTFLLATLCDTASIYGPNAPSFGMEPWHPAIHHAWQMLRGERLTVRNYELYEKEPRKDEEHPLEPYHVTEQVRCVGYPSGSARFSGRLLGGCLDCLVNLAGTRFDHAKEFCGKYRGDQVIWFLEACDLNVFGIRRAMWKLREAGWFETAAGFLIGRPYEAEPLFGLDHIQAVTDILGPLGVPVLLDLDIGHVPPMMPLITGSLADVTFENGKLTIEMALK